MQSNKFYGAMGTKKEVNKLLLDPRIAFPDLDLKLEHYGRRKELRRIGEFHIQMPQLDGEEDHPFYRSS